MPHLPPNPCRIPLFYLPLSSLSIDAAKMVYWILKHKLQAEHNYGGIRNIHVQQTCLQCLCVETFRGGRN